MSAALDHARVSPHEAARLMREAGHVYLDVRGPQEFLLGHPSGAYNVPCARGGEARLVEIVRACFPPDAKLVVGCQSGIRSREAAAALDDAGFEVVEQRAGYGGVRDAFGRVLERGWQAEGLPCEMRAQPGHDYASLLSRAGL